MRAWSLGARIPHRHHELISKVGSQILNKLTSTSSLGNDAAVGLSSVPVFSGMNNWRDWSPLWGDDPK